MLGIATIVSKEIASSDKEIFDDGNADDFQTSHKSSFTEPSLILDQASASREPSDFAWHRVRTVSIDNENGSPGQSRRFIKTKPISLPAVVTPVGTRLRSVRKPTIKLLATKGKKEQIKFPKLSNAQQQTHNHNLPNIMSQHKRKATEQSVTKGKSLTIIHRKKFSWKNYPGE